MEEEYQVPDEQHRWALEYLLAMHDEAVIRETREPLRDRLKQWILDNCQPDENGNYIYYFPHPIYIGRSPVKGLMAQRRVSEFINEDRAFNIAEKYNVLDKVTYEVVTEELDMDMMYVLNQQGVIPDDDIDSIIELKETFALVQLKD